jgi:hypothetical protein
MFGAFVMKKAIVATGHYTVQPVVKFYKTTQM